VSLLALGAIGLTVLLFRVISPAVQAIHISWLRVLVAIVLYMVVTFALGCVGAALSSWNRR
jgi:hypothetical protein